MTPSQAYRAALQAAEKVADTKGNTYKMMTECFTGKAWEMATHSALVTKEIAAAIRALPVPEDVGDFRITQKANPTADIIAKGMKELEDGDMVLVPDKEPQRWISLKDINGVLHKNNCLYWQLMAQKFGQPKTLYFLKDEIASLKAIRDEMEDGKL